MRRKRVFVYKRTHEGDPRNGCFGVRDCMGKARSLGFDAVIGIGGMGAKAKKSGISGKVNWIGIGPRKKRSRYGRGRPLVTFKHFIYFPKGACRLRMDSALAKRMYSPHDPRRAPRFVFDNFNREEQKQINRLLDKARRKPPSGVHSASHGCPPVKSRGSTHC